MGQPHSSPGRLRSDETSRSAALGNNKTSHIALKGMVGEAFNKLAAYLAVVSRKLTQLPRSLVLRSRPDVVATWDDSEVAKRWWALCPKRNVKHEIDEPFFWTNQIFRELTIAQMCPPTIMCCGPSQQHFTTLVNGTWNVPTTLTFVGCVSGDANLCQFS